MDYPSFLSPANISFYIENTSRSGGVSTNGQEQVVSSGVGRWRCDLSGCPITPENVLQYRGWIAGMRGRSSTTIVPAWDHYAPWPIDPLTGRTLHPDLTRNPRLDGTPYADPEIPEASRIRVVSTVAAARRATTIGLTVQSGSPLLPGMYLSPSPGRLHLITESIGGNLYRIEPPLREPVALNQAVDMMRPSCTMRLVDDAGGSLALEYGRWGFVDLSFVEAL